MRKEEKKKEKSKVRNKERKQRDRMAGMHQQVDPLSPSKSPTLCQKQKYSFGHKPFKFSSLKVINFHDKIFLGRLFTLRKNSFPPWSWSCDITWHNRLIFFFLLLTHVLPIYFHHFLYKAFLIIVIIILIGDYLFTLSKGKSTLFYYYYYYHACLS